MYRNYKEIAQEMCFKVYIKFFITNTYYKKETFFTERITVDLFELFVLANTLLKKAYKLKRIHISNPAYFKQVNHPKPSITASLKCTNEPFI